MFKIGDRGPENEPAYRLYEIVTNGPQTGVGTRGERHRLLVMTSEFYCSGWPGHRERVTYLDGYHTLRLRNRAKGGTDKGGQNAASGRRRAT